MLGNASVSRIFSRSSKVLLMSIFPPVPAMMTPPELLLSESYTSPGLAHNSRSLGQGVTLVDVDGDVLVDLLLILCLSVLNGLLDDVIVGLPCLDL